MLRRQFGNILRLGVRAQSTAAASTAETGAATAAAVAKKRVVIQSMAPAGTTLKGINVKKTGADPVALSEEEYPEWLWALLDPVAQEKKLDANPELKAKKERRAANRKHIKSKNFIAKM